VNVRALWLRPQNDPAPRHHRASRTPEPPRVWVMPAIGKAYSTEREEQVDVQFGSAPAQVVQLRA
jgi:hypothetical protein